ncbi:MAG: hypothetical protein DI564_15915 [Rhodanobacter denitrificans]|uniref:IPT/TIG domain-containing protein n=1 Tax=Rhodanobacter denitrificans TaxID=666685 RepID=A0A2W5LZD9_9GAMM|nr:MAG: hypothetical protein DI564_15915 [Rhodanobacter denitrificans]
MEKWMSHGPRGTGCTAANGRSTKAAPYTGWFRRPRGGPSRPRRLSPWLLGWFLIGLISWAGTALAVTISSFSPNRGEPWTSVRINGSGFSTTVEDNFVTFNGVPAETYSATATRLMVYVPDGATSGPISVTVNGQTATSSAVFRVPPQIHSFTPGAVAGNVITIRGVNFGETPAANQVDFNGLSGSVTTASATQLTVTVPTGVSTGPITLTAYGFSTTPWSNFVVLSAQPQTGSELLYASSADSGGVIVVDSATAQPVAAISTGQGAGKMIVNTAGTRAYVLNHTASSVAVVDTATHSVLASIATDQNPSDLYLDTSGSFLYVIGSQRVTVIDLGTNTATASIDPGIGFGYGTTYGTVRDHALNRLYVTYYLSGSIPDKHLARIDMATGGLIDSRPIAAFTVPEDLHANPAGGSFYYTDNSQLQRFDVSAGVVSATYALAGSGSSSILSHLGVAGDPLYALHYASHTLNAVDPATENLLWNVQIPGYPGAFVVGPGESEAYISTGDLDVSIVDLHAETLSETIVPDVDSIRGLRANTGGDRLFVLGYSGALKAIDTISRTVVGSSQISGPGGLLVVNTIPADRLGVVRRQNEESFADAYVDVPFEIVVQAHHGGGPTNVVASTAVSVALASGTSGSLSGPSGCTIPAGRSYCLVRGLAIDTVQPAARLILTATSGDALASVTSPPFAVIGTAEPSITNLDPDRGPVGASVRIIGADLLQDPGIVPEVYFNGVAAVVTSSADEEIVATVPVGATTGPVAVHVSGSMAESPGDFTVLPVPSIVISQIEPAVPRYTAPYVATVELTRPSPSDPVPTGSVTVTDLTNQVSCTFVLPQTGCSLVAPSTTPNTILLSATYAGDSNYGTVTSATSQQRIAYGTVAIEIGNVVPQTSHAGQGSFVFFTITPVVRPWNTSLLPIGYVRITDGTNSCSYGTQFDEIAGGGCALSSPIAGTRTIRAYFHGDYNYGSAWSEPVTQSVSSPGGATPLPAGTELCGFDPDADYPPQTGFVPIGQLSGGVPSLGLERSIHGAAPVSVTVTSPVATSTVNGRSVDVVGTFEGPVNTGITVNGVVAATANGRFLAVAVPVEPGANTLDVVATTMTGATATASVSVQASADPALIAIEANDQVGQVGFGPFQAVYHMNLDNLPSSVTVSNVRLDLNGDGIWEHEGATLDGAPNAYTFPHPGLYRARLDVNHGGFVADRYILVRDRIAQRSMLCDIYGYLRDRLAAQDLIGAADVFHPDRRTEYVALLSALGAQMPTFAQQLGTVVDGQFSGGMADLTLVRDQSDETRTGYPLRLMQGSDGVWRILEM